MPPNDRSLATSTDASLTLHGEQGGGRGASVAQVPGYGTLQVV